MSELRGSSLSVECPYPSCGNVVTVELHYASRKEGLQGPPSHEDIFWYKSDGAHHLNALTDLGSSEAAMIEAFWRTLSEIETSQTNETRFVFIKVHSLARCYIWTKILECAIRGRRQLRAGICKGWMITWDYNIYSYCGIPKQLRFECWHFYDRAGILS